LLERTYRSANVIGRYGFHGGNTETIRSPFRHAEYSVSRQVDRQWSRERFPAHTGRMIPDRNVAPPLAAERKPAALV